MFCGPDALSLTLREGNLECRLFGPKREEVTGGWRKFHNESFIMCIFTTYY
jgi:hypothetical protein